MENKKIDLNNWIITDPTYCDQYEPFFEVTDLVFILTELKGEEKEEFIRLEKQQNPIHFKKFREKRPDLFE